MKTTLVRRLKTLGWTQREIAIHLIVNYGMSWKSAEMSVKYA